MTEATDETLTAAPASASESDVAGPSPASPSAERPAVEVAWSSEGVPAAEAAPAGSWSTFWLTDRDIVAFTAVAAVVLVLLVARWGQLSGWGAVPIEIERLTPLELDARLDLNAATWVELAQLEGVGETLAERIVAYREAHGPFKTVDDLDAVKGIGPKTLERLRTHLVVAPPAATQE